MYKTPGPPCQKIWPVSRSIKADSPLDTGRVIPALLDGVSLSLLDIGHDNGSTLASCLDISYFSRSVIAANAAGGGGLEGAEAAAAAPSAKRVTSMTPATMRSRDSAPPRGAGRDGLK